MTHSYPRLRLAHWELMCFGVAFQGMDSVTRQTNQHVEYEPEWEGAFNLQLKLADILTMIVDWCSTDVS